VKAFIECDLFITQTVLPVMDTDNRRFSVISLLKMRKLGL